MQASTPENLQATEAAVPESSRPEGQVPDRHASFEEKMRYYRSQHTTVGVRATHLVGIPGVAFSIPVLFARPRVGLPTFAVSWALQVAGHKFFEKNKPALTKGFLTYQFCGLAFWCEEMIDLVGGRSLFSPDS
jgi:uncharacterized membrane protein YGL010W